MDPSASTDPAHWTLGTWILGGGAACLGGVVNWYAKVRAGHTRAFNLVELLGEMFISSVVGMGVFMAAQGLSQPIALSAALAGLGGHMGTRLLFVIERAAETRIRGGKSVEGETNEADV